MLQTELSLAADIQHRLLPQVPPSSNGCEWAAALRPAGLVGGDFLVVAVREAAADERQLIKRSSHDHVRAVKWSEVI